MLLEATAMQAPQEAEQGQDWAGVPVAFRRYVLEQHDRYARARRAREFQGLHLHRAGYGTDGQIGVNQWTQSWADHLEEAVELELDAKRAQAAARYERVEAAILEMERRDRRHALVLRFYMEDDEIREHSVRQLAGRLAVSEDVPRRMLPRAVRKLYKLLGGVW